MVAGNADTEGNDGYNVKTFFSTGERDLYPIGLRELPYVFHLSLLNLQCHFGLGTLTLARKGATVTGCDYSFAAITKARKPKT